MFGLDTGFLAAAIIAVIAAFGYIAKMIHTDGKEAAKTAQREAETKARNTADEIDDAVAGRTAKENRDRLKRW